MTDRERALEALARWRGQKPWARKDPSTLDVVEVAAVGPTQLRLVSIYEARGVRYELRPAPSRPALREDGPDPWSVRLEHPPELPVGNEVSTPLSGMTVHMDCGICSGAGELHCTNCEGTGRIKQGRYSYTCPECNGRGEVRCKQCQGSGGLIGRPSVWSRIEQHERVQVVESAELPIDAFLDLQQVEHGGELIHEQTGDRIVDLQREGGYRDAAGGADPVRKAAQALGAEPGVPTGAQILRQRLEVRRVPAWELALRAGQKVVVYGDPPKVSPPKALDSTALEAARVAPYALAALALGGGLLWLVLP